MFSHMRRGLQNLLDWPDHIKMRSMTGVSNSYQRWFQFRLRTLFALVAFVAIACWAIWVAWPWYAWGSEEAHFEQSVRQLKAGQRAGSEESLVVNGFGHVGQHAAQSRDGLEHTLIVRSWPNATYCLHTANKVNNGLGYPPNKRLKVELFRLPAGCLSRADNYNTVRCEFDFLRFLSNDRDGDPGFKYELIYSDTTTDPTALEPDKFDPVLAREQLMRIFGDTKSAAAK
jgi:hypothetical protein